MMGVMGVGFPGWRGRWNHGTGRGRLQYLGWSGFEAGAVHSPAFFGGLRASGRLGGGFELLSPAAVYRLGKWMRIDKERMSLAQIFQPSLSSASNASVLPSFMLNTTSTTTH